MKSTNAELARYEYDAMGRRAKRVEGSTSSRYVYSGPRLLSEYQGSGTLTLKSNMLYGAGMDETLAIDSGGSRHFVHQNALGSTMAITSAAGAVEERYYYEAFGAPYVVNGSGSQIVGANGLPASSVGNHHWFAGARFDQESGQYHMRARQYEPRSGKFVSRDPLGYVNGPNPYTYVNHDPVNWLDPFGLASGGFPTKSWGDMAWYEKAWDVTTNLPSGLLDTVTSPKKVAGAFISEAAGASAMMVGGSLYILEQWGGGATHWASDAMFKSGQAWNKIGLDLYSGGNPNELPKIWDPYSAGGYGMLGASFATSFAKSSAPPSIPPSPKQAPPVKGPANVGLNCPEGINVSQKGLDLVENHLSQFGNDPANAAMLQKLKDALAAGQKVLGPEANFYLHEAAESTMMKAGLGYDAAHAAALQKYGISPFSLYSPDVIQANPQLFNNAWKSFWGLWTSQ